MLTISLSEIGRVVVELAEVVIGYKGAYEPPSNLHR
jgi:hypothetical protein